MFSQIKCFEHVQTRVSTWNNKRVTKTKKFCSLSSSSIELYKKRTPGMEFP